MNVPRSPVCIKFVKLSYKVLCSHILRNNPLAAGGRSKLERIGVWYIQQLEADKIRRDVSNLRNINKKTNEKVALFNALVQLISDAKNNIEDNNPVPMPDSNGALTLMNLVNGERFIDK